MMRWKTLVLATASFGLLTGVAVAQDQAEPQTNPPIEQKQDDQNKVNDQNKVDDKVDETKKEPGNLPGDVDTNKKGTEGMGTEPGKGMEPDTKGTDQPKGDVGTEPKGDLKGDTDVKGAEPKTDVGAGTDIKGGKGGMHLSKVQLQDVQQKLKDQGLYQGEIDGVIGKQSKAAIKQFQQSKNLTANGQLDSATLNAMGVNVQPGAQP